MSEVRAGDSWGGLTGLPARVHRARVEVMLGGVWQPWEVWMAREFFPVYEEDAEGWAERDDESPPGLKEREGRIFMPPQKRD